MTSVLYRLGQLCVRRRWIVLALWLVVVVALAVAARTVGPNVNDNLTLPGTTTEWSPLAATVATFIRRHSGAPTR